MNQNLPEIDIAIHADTWGVEDKLRVTCEKAISATASIAKLQWPQMAELSIVFTNDDEMATINSEWRDMQKSTNVLSFPGDYIAVGQTSGPMIGDIIFAYETISTEAMDQNKSFEDHLTHLIAHGFLHLFGYDHIEDSDAEIMESLETKILSALAIADPYN